MPLAKPAVSSDMVFTPVDVATNSLRITAYPFTLCTTMLRRSPASAYFNTCTWLPCAGLGTTDAPVAVEAILVAALLLVAALQAPNGFHHQSAVPGVTLY